MEDMVSFERCLRILFHLYHHTTEEIKKELLSGNSDVEGAEYLQKLLEAPKGKLVELFSMPLESLSVTKYVQSNK